MRQVADQVSGTFSLKSKESKRNKTALYQGIILGLLILAVGLRFWQLNTVPPGFWFDEGYNAMDAVRILQTGTWPVFFPGNQGQEPLFKYLLVLSISLFGEGIYQVRLVSVWLGVLSVALMYRWSWWDGPSSGKRTAWP